MIMQFVHIFEGIWRDATRTNNFNREDVIYMNRKKVKKIKDYILSQNEPDDNKISAIEYLVNECPEAIVPFLKKALKKYIDNYRLRICLADNLANFGGDKVLSSLITLIKAPENFDKRSDLIYAIEKLDCQKYYLEFVKISCSGDAESRMNAYFIVEKYLDEIDNETRAKSLQLLKKRKKEFVAELSKKEKVGPFAKSELDGINYLIAHMS